MSKLSRWMVDKPHWAFLITVILAILAIFVLAYLGSRTS